MSCCRNSLAASNAQLSFVVRRHLTGIVAEMSKGAFLHHSNLAATLVAALFCVNAYSQDCDDLSASGDGVPAEYYQEVCKGDVAVSSSDLAAAIEHYQAASEIHFFEAPNYRVRVKLGEAMCLNGRVEEGRSVLESFTLMAKADLGEIECPGFENAEEWPEHIHLACEGYGSGLYEWAAEELREMLVRAEELSETCDVAAEE